MRGEQPIRHTVRSHGVQIARNHVHDWIILVLLVVLEITLYSINPFHRFVGKDMMYNLKYPLKNVTIPVWVVGIYGVLVPIIVITFFYFRRRDVYDLHHGLLALGFTMLIAGVLTEALKNASGRPRPDFFWRCFPDGKDVYDKLGSVVCHGKASVIKDGYKSFPSGHTSWSFAGLIFLMLYLSGKFRAFDHRGEISKLLVVIFPPVAAALVGISLVDDYFHHWQDILAGAIIGTAVASLCYLHFFPTPYSVKGWAPYAYFRALDEARNVLPNNAMDQHNGQATGLHGVQGQCQYNRESPRLSEVPSANLDAMEFGR